MRKWLHVAGMQGAWFAAALLASGAWHLVGAAANVLVLLVHVFTSGAVNREVVRAGAALGLGFVVELTHHYVGHVQAQQAGVWPPLWLLSLWPVFASSMMTGNSLSWLRPRLLLASALGAVVGPVSYSGGARLGALELSGLQSVATISLCWAVAMPALAVLARRLEPDAPHS